MARGSGRTAAASVTGRSGRHLTEPRQRVAVGVGGRNRHGRSDRGAERAIGRLDQFGPPEAQGARHRLGIARRLDRCLGVALEQRAERTAAQRRRTRGADEIEERGRDVDVLEGCLYVLRLGVARHLHEERHPYHRRREREASSRVVGAVRRAAVGGGDDDQGVVVPALPAERVEHRANRRVRCGEDHRVGTGARRVGTLGTRDGGCGAVQLERVEEARRVLLVEPGRRRLGRGRVLTLHGGPRPFGRWLGPLGVVVREAGAEAGLRPQQERRDRSGRLEPAIGQP